jgi:hypothetical protein
MSAFTSKADTVGAFMNTAVVRWPIFSAPEETKDADGQTDLFSIYGRAVAE